MTRSNGDLLHFVKLDWDSKFFGFNVGRVSGEVTNKNHIEELFILIKDNDSRLTYFSSVDELNRNLLSASRVDCVLVDRKTIYSKPINNIAKHDIVIRPYDSQMSKEQLFNLALQSGEYSRFNIDGRISREKFEEMYHLWMSNSLNGRMAKEILVSFEGNNISGFVTLTEQSGNVSIGIIAVDAFYRGKGIGKALIQSAEKWCIEKDYENINVVTQGDNIPACRLYESCGYNLTHLEYFYHIWSDF